MFNVMEADRGTTVPVETLRSCRLSDAQILKWQSYMTNSTSVKKCGFYVIYVATTLYLTNGRNTKTKTKQTTGNQKEKIGGSRPYKVSC